MTSAYREVKTGDPQFPRRVQSQEGKYKGESLERTGITWSEKDKAICRMEEKG